ncbi:MAG TPA: helix-turn-helix domain-containing protein [Methanomassiliicoccaceae archaeon]|jgi:predicted DNA binding protein|nr:hypothetical protein [Euryarchaeota archaeon]HOB38639.1 helix-turn-helix domain-containing protein [Methanomassiliicoccaceae archaeon]HOL07630.1 helix-turn-helix domain-containing protein [Methanomassiliicoccaceae archaeon]HPT74401.1 helix-turn-helix domain-containing protein [Methanomassiliicoccaceae archaeon]HQA21041.1 helix-turn-helix domain-containing protein [Methanomassiliicoccaceae archaeon]
MLEATIRVKPLESWAIDISKKLSVPIRIVESAMGQDGTISSLVEFRLEGTTKEAVLKEIARHPDTSELVISEEREDAILGSITVNKWLMGQALQRTNIYVIGARTVKQGAVEWRLLATDEAVLRDLVDDLREAGSKVSLQRKRQIGDFNLLTKRQEMILEKALEMGYYDYPRGVTGRELAKRLGISQSTLYETLQNAQRKLAETYFLKKRMN